MVRIRVQFGALVHGRLAFDVVGSKLNEKLDDQLDVPEKLSEERSRCQVLGRDGSTTMKISQRAYTHRFPTLSTCSQQDCANFCSSLEIETHKEPLLEGSRIQLPGGWIRVWQTWISTHTIKHTANETDWSGSRTEGLK